MPAIFLRSLEAVPSAHLLIRCQAPVRYGLATDLQGPRVVFLFWESGLCSVLSPVRNAQVDLAAIASTPVNWLRALLAAALS